MQHPAPLIFLCEGIWFCALALKALADRQGALLPEPPQMPSASWVIDAANSMYGDPEEDLYGDNRNDGTFDALMKKVGGVRIDIAR